MNTCFIFSCIVMTYIDIDRIVLTFDRARCSGETIDCHATKQHCSCQYALHKFVLHSLDP